LNPEQRQPTVQPRYRILKQLPDGIARSDLRFWPAPARHAPIHRRRCHRIDISSRKAQEQRGSSMTTMTDYAGFLTWLHRQARVSDDAKRIANTVHIQFERIEKTSSNKGERSRVLTPMLTENFAGIDPAPPPIAAGDGGEARSWVRLSELKVGPFRGFRLEETFDLRTKRDRQDKLLRGA